ncbi:AAA+ ATPase superfamily predicted ATPase [Salinibacter ruber]|jgi:hypothetical protein|uniref:AAA+ ATPase superfamily predicted ATPase n=1 Tax=Salinibacter ruber TaxID=146919 RepID=A0AAW5PD57_9BACT|nr:hypothetical protein [Salinibacter ruber]MCS4044650.1 AAA+ ATPase superfamily predicted ATPase [Salinibacter ruber]MCS4159255.1 AAA+ ATPase superfamily predicted ATPase [Salinibacter ruber]MCS4223739.1 AAA+ ATPase superfamily predicted ATPase [Salinibacter ruber]
MSFRQVHSLRHSQPTVVDPSKSIDEAVKHLTQRQERQATERKAKQKHRRERDKAARRWWWKHEEALSEASDQFSDWHDNYEALQPRMRIGSK